MRKLLLPVLAVALAGTACASAALSSDRGRATASPSPSPSTIVLIPGQIWFDPPGDAQPELTSSEAMTVFEGVNADLHLPADVTAHLGFYTAAAAPGIYRYKDRLAWGFTFYECVSPRGGRPPPNPPVCTAWLFLDANTGEMLEATWQQVSP